jgi:ankyrin repeat protein
MRYGAWVWIVVCATVLAGVVALLVYFKPTIRYTSRIELVGPEEAIELVKQKGSLDQIKLAVAKSGKGVDGITFLGCSLLFWAVDTDREDVVVWALGEGANPNGIAPAAAPLLAAVYKNNPKMVKLLVAAGADPDFDTGFGITPRSSAARRKYAEVLSAMPPPKGAGERHEPGKP